MFMVLVFGLGVFRFLGFLSFLGGFVLGYFDFGFCLFVLV